MIKGTVGRLLFLFACVITLVAIVVPCQKIEVITGKKTDVSYTGLMPSVTGAVLILLAVMGILLSLGRHCRYSPWIGTIAGILIGVKLVLLSAANGHLEHTANKFAELFKEVGATNLDNLEYTRIVSNYYGFYVLAGAAVLMIITSFICLVTNPPLEE